MSVIFSIKNKKRLLLSEPVMTVDNALNLVEGLTQFFYDETDDTFNASKFYHTPLSKFKCIQVGIYGQSGRGFEIAFEKDIKSYTVRVNTPATSTDWKHAIQFMQALSLKLGSEIISENGDVYTADTIQEFDYEYDIISGIKHFSDIVKTNEEYILFGVLRPVVIGNKLADQLSQSDSMIKDFDELMLRTQYVDAYSANQAFFKNSKNDEIIGVYTLTQELNTVLPYRPYVEYHNLERLGEQKVNHWDLNFVGYTDENDSNSYYSMGTMNYDDFIARLDKEKYYFLDDCYIVVQGLTEEEMKNHLQSAEE